MSPPVNLELRQTIVIKNPNPVFGGGSIMSGLAGGPSNTGLSMLGPQGLRIESFTPCGKGFLVVGSNGHCAIYDRTDEKRDPYVEVKRFTLGSLHFIGNCLLLRVKLV